jgi:hypothetical protein
MIEVTSVRIEGCVFDGDPMINRIDSRVYQQIALGPALIPIPDDGRSWHICKYTSNEPCIDLTHLRREDVQAIATEFGIPVGARYTDEAAFFRSPAWRALCVWVERHPRMARRIKESNYLGNWPARALANHERTQ